MFNIDKSTLKAEKGEQEAFNLTLSSNCGSNIKVTELLVIVACPENGVLEVFIKRSMKVIYSLLKWQEFSFGSDISLIEHA